MQPSKIYTGERRVRMLECTRRTPQGI